MKEIHPCINTVRSTVILNICRVGSHKHALAGRERNAVQRSAMAWRRPMAARQGGLEGGWVKTQ